MLVHYKQADQVSELKQVLALQRLNVETVISSEEARDEGFVTVHHTLELLIEMNTPHGHIIAKNESQEVIGYCLVMLKEMYSKIPVLASLIHRINQISFKDVPLSESNYCIMGQVCIDKVYRGKGVFYGLYSKMKDALANHFDYIITSIAKRNTRSVQAHLNVGFQIVDEYLDEQDDWFVVVWEI